MKARITLKNEMNEFMKLNIFNTLFRLERLRQDLHSVHLAMCYHLFCLFCSGVSNNTIQRTLL